MTILVASILDADHLRLAEEIRLAEDAGVDAFSFDVMDGHFVPRIELGPQYVAQLRQETDLPLEVHLMINDPESFVEVYCDAGPDLVSFHFEAAKSPEQIISYIKGRGLLAGIAVKHETPLETIPNSLLSQVDHVLLLAVPAGFGGAPAGESAVHRIRKMRELLVQSSNENATIEVDGGVKPQTTGIFAEAGADLVVIGTGIYKSPDYVEAVAEAKQNIALHSQQFANSPREASFMAKPSLGLASDKNRRERLERLRSNLDIPSRIWDPLSSPR
ncbi:ribulose-phosphate 3-epimerase [Dietzia sp. SL131]|uniref:ribulose-phosphate 3-epimerase n=1 Tax=Dietzia sp. SL131 TaxID=2995149 RepID=UPI00227CF5C6|nr:ribulose-phosphate 3-epimerase [Dietzia sp. SL131]MCY1658230.1 ribulose-phosphate 3-epimerase [Dietzia sp. SL131]